MAHTSSTTHTNT